MSELRQALRDMKVTAAIDQSRHLDEELIVAGDEEDVELEQEISELNQEIVIKMEVFEEVEEADGDDETNGRDSIGTPESGDGGDGDDLIMSEDDLGRSRFRCQHPECTRLFKQKNDLTKHQNVHTTRFQCQECQKCFQSKQELDRHLSVHSCDRPFACDWPGCGGTYKLEIQLKLHRKEVHVNERTFQCTEDGCGKSFKTKRYLSYHLKYAHSFLRPFKCQMQECGKRFITKAHMARHLKYVHSDVRNYRCHFKDCGKTFKNRQNLAQHLKFHS